MHSLYVGPNLGLGQASVVTNVTLLVFHFSMDSLHMVHHVCFLGKSVQALGALVRLLLHVHRCDVAPNVTTVGCPIRAQQALLGFDLTVNSFDVRV